MGPKSGNEAAVIGRFWRDRNEGRIGLPSLSRSGQMVGRGLGRQSSPAGGLNTKMQSNDIRQDRFLLLPSLIGADLRCTTIGLVRLLFLRLRRRHECAQFFAQRLKGSNH